MITSSGPGDLFTVRNVGNLVPVPGTESADDSVAAAIEYAVDVLEVRSITVCGHSGCGAMQALLNAPPAEGEPATPLGRWLRHGLPSLDRMAAEGSSWATLKGGPRRRRRTALPGQRRPAAGAPAGARGGGPPAGRGHAHAPGHVLPRRGGPGIPADPLAGPLRPGGRLPRAERPGRGARRGSG
ncbi:carbonic anhydrase [Actinomadura keratinilytica]